MTPGYHKSLFTLMAQIIMTTSVFSTHFDAQSDILQDSSELFREEFDGNMLNSSLWEVPEGSTRSCSYHMSNAIVQNGRLHLKAHRLESQKTLPFSCVLVISRLNNFFNGEIEWKASAPQGDGLWSTLSLLPFSCSHYQRCQGPLFLAWTNFRNSWTTEMNVEIIWQNSLNYSTGNNRTTTMLKKTSSSFRLYKLVWLPDSFTWYVDGNPIFRTADKFATSFFHMKVAMGLEVYETTDQHPTFPAEFQIEYIVARKLRNATDPTTTVDATTSTNNAPSEINGPAEFGTVSIYITISLGCVLGITFLILVINFCIRKQRTRQQVPTTDVQDAVLSDDPRSNDSYLLVPKDNSRQVSDLNSIFQFLEIPVSQLEQTSEMLGKGQFGTVFKGFLSDDKGGKSNEKKVVAIKTFLNHSDSEEKLQREMFIKEMEITIKVGRHLNIVNLLGFLTIGNPILMVLEYCANGSLLSYLQKNRNGFVNCVNKNGFKVSNHAIPLVPGSDYVNDVAVSSLSRGHMFTQSKTSPQLSTDDLVRIAYQIARGLEYLAGRSIIHRDLAARNVLVCENNIVKICDFGLARERILSDYTLKDNEVALPIRWMAPESILEGIFSYKSDVWSFGVLLWEIFSLGELPFNSTTGSKFTGKIFEFAHAVAGGLRMQRPIYSPLLMYDIMLRCWNYDKDARPSALILTQELLIDLTDGSADCYLVLDEPYQAYNSTHAECLNSNL